MSPVRVVPGLNPGKDCQSCLGVRLSDPPVNQLTFQRRKESLRHGVVIGIAHCARARARAQAHFFEALAKLNAGVLGEFNRLSQHLNYGGVVWQERRGGYKIRQVGQRCVRRAALRSINGSSSRHSGNISRQACQARMRPEDAGFRSHWGRAGFAKPADCADKSGIYFG